MNGWEVGGWLGRWMGKMCRTSLRDQRSLVVIGTQDFFTDFYVL